LGLAIAIRNFEAEALAQHRHIMAVVVVRLVAQMKLQLELRTETAYRLTMDNAY
jgi:hypothetical protein